MSWKKGDKARIVQDDPIWIQDGARSRIGQEVTVLAINCGGYAHIKVSNSDGDIFYCRPSWIRKPNVPTKKRQTKSIKQQAEQLAEKRMKEIEEKIMETEIVAKAKQARFSDIAKKFYALSSLVRENKDENDESKNIVILLAERGIFEDLKNGVIWDGD